VRSKQGRASFTSVGEERLAAASRAEIFARVRSVETEAGSPVFLAFEPLSTATQQLNRENCLTILARMVAETHCAYPSLDRIPDSPTSSQVGYF
jgi:hypothetical protein